MGSFWHSIWSLLQSKLEPQRSAVQHSPAESPEIPVALLSSEEEDDLRLVQFAPEMGSSLPIQRRLLDLLDQLDQQLPLAVEEEEIQQLITNLLAEAPEHQALELLERLAHHLPQFPRLRLRLAQLYYDRAELAPALEILQAVLEAPGCELEAHLLLAEHHYREAEPQRALLHYEAVLALDYENLRARQQTQEMKRQLDQPQSTSTPTILGTADLGPLSRFILQRELGRGGCGIVYLALDQTLQRKVAVKALHRHINQRPEAWARLFCEARISAALDLPGIITIYDLDESLCLVIMEYCAGGTLAQHVAMNGTLPTGQILRRMSELAALLDAVHRCGVVHRDLKPANLLIRQAILESSLPPLILTDFGIAHLEREEHPTQDAEGSLIYMSPEQRRAAPLDGRSDLFALGVIVLELLLGRPPLDRHQALLGVDFLELDELWRELRQRLPRVLNTPLIQLLQKLLHPDPAVRCSDGATLQAQLALLAQLQKEHEVHQQVISQLEQLAGPAPRQAEVERWLDEQRKLQE